MKEETFNSREDWLKWRKAGLGSSDVPVILNLSPYKSAFELFQEKTNRKELTQNTNPAIERGIELEPIARRLFADRYNFINDAVESFSPINLISRDYDFLRASLDGLSNDKTLVIEIKYQGRSAHEAFKQGTLRPDYYAQVQHQLFVSDAISACIVSINDEQQITHKFIQRNESYILSSLKKCIQFWNCVKENRWPTEMPYIRDQNPQSMTELFEEWRELKDELKTLEEKKKEIEKIIFSSDVEICGPFRVSTVERKGSIEYGKIEILKTIDLEQYRGKTITYKQIKLSKD